MANAGMNPKALQYIMGHANITMTLDYYTHVDACSVKAEMERLEKQEVGVPVHRDGGFLSPIFQHPLQRPVDRLTHRDFPIAALG